MKNFLKMAAVCASLLGAPWAVAQTPVEVVQRALVDVPLVSKAMELGRKINAQSAIDAPQGSDWFVVKEGDGRVIVTAPHATESMRNGVYRFSDGGMTAALAQALHERACATVIYTQYRSPQDPAYYDDNGFKQALGRLIERDRPQLVLDLHGSHSYRPYDVDFGTMNGKSLLGRQDLVDDLHGYLRREGVVNFSSNWFAASSNSTVTRFAANAGVPAIQLEINSSWLNPGENYVMSQRFSQLMQGLIRYTRHVGQTPQGACTPN